MSLFRARPRVSGRPPSPNGASSLHLLWHLPRPEPLVEAAVTLTVADPPTVDRLYFWAMQISFAGGGGAHLGLQWGVGAGGRMRHANWGGYGADGSVLDGSASPLPSSFGDANTGVLDWDDGPHRLRVTRGPRGWTGWVDDIALRDLYVDAPTLHSPMVWSEVFAACDDPSVVVRWSNLEVTTASGARVAVDHVRANYQSHAHGGCANTCSWVDGDDFVQATNAPRSPVTELTRASPTRWS